MALRNFILLTVIFFAGASQAQLRTVPYVDVSRYLGTWYQISHNPLPFEQGCVCSRQVLSPAEGGLVGVYNSCNYETARGPVRDIRGTATNDDPTTNARFTVDFGLPAKGQYWIIGLGDNYEYAVVSEPSLRSLYILSKTPTLPATLYDEAVAKAAVQVDPSRLEKTSQENCVYPSGATNP